MYLLYFLTRFSVRKTVVSVKGHLDNYSGLNTGTEISGIWTRIRDVLPLAVLRNWQMSSSSAVSVNELRANLPLTLYNISLEVKKKFISISVLVVEYSNGKIGIRHRPSYHDRYVSFTYL